MNVIPFAPEHVLTMRLQPQQAISQVVAGTYLANLARMGPSHQRDVEGLVAHA